MNNDFLIYIQVRFVVNLLVFMPNDFNFSALKENLKKALFTHFDGLQNGPFNKNFLFKYVLESYKNNP